MVWLVCALCAFADSYTPSQKIFRNDIHTFLKEEGYAPFINSDTGDINFKMDGTNFIIDLNKDYNGPFLVTLSASFGMESLSNSDKVRLFETENLINSKYHCIKVSYVEYNNNNLLIFSVESFCHNSDDFKYALVKYLDIMKSSISEFTNLYSDNSSSIPDYTSNYSNQNLQTVGSISSRSGNRIYLNAPILESSHHKWWANSIELN